MLYLCCSSSEHFNNNLYKVTQISVMLYLEYPPLKLSTLSKKSLLAITSSTYRSAGQCLNDRDIVHHYYYLIILGK